MSNLQQYQADISINQETGESFTSLRGLVRLCGAPYNTVRDWVSKGERNFGQRTAEIHTPGGIQGGRIFTETEIAITIGHFNPTLAGQLMQIGVRSLMHRLAGYEVKSTAMQPMSQLQMISYMALELESTQQRLTSVEEKLEKHLPPENYMTVVAYINNNPGIEKPTNYSAAGKALTKLSKALNVEVKKVPDAKYGACNSYHLEVLDAYFSA